MKRKGIFDRFPNFQNLDSILRWVCSAKCVTSQFDYLGKRSSNLIAN